MIRRIKLKNLPNTRDLGSIKTVDGKTIKNGMLIRSGSLNRAAPADIAILTNKYHLKQIVDLRTEAEIIAAPDPVIEGVHITRLALLDESFLGIARDNYSIECWLNMFKNSTCPPSDIYSDMYIKLLFSEHVKPLVYEFFNVLINNTDGSVLWHCSAGKDRVGVLTAMLLSALGVDRKTVIKDYLMTARFCRAELIKLRLFLPLKCHDKKQRNCIYVLYGVKKEYINRIFSVIDNEFGGVCEFLFKQFGITEEMICKLKNKYLD